MVSTITNVACLLFTCIAMECFFLAIKSAQWEENLVRNETYMALTGWQFHLQHHCHQWKRCHACFVGHWVRHLGQDPLLRGEKGWLLLACWEWKSWTAFCWKESWGTLAVSLSFTIGLEEHTGWDASTHLIIYQDGWMINNCSDMHWRCFSSVTRCCNLSSTRSRGKFWVQLIFER